MEDLRTILLVSFAILVACPGVFGLEHRYEGQLNNMRSSKRIAPAIQNRASKVVGCTGLDPGDANITCRHPKLEKRFGDGMDCTARVPVKTQAFFVNCPTGFALVEDYQIIICKFPGKWDKDVFTCEEVSTEAPPPTTTNKTTTRNTTTTKPMNTTTTTKPTTTVLKLAASSNTTTIASNAVTGTTSNVTTVPTVTVATTSLGSSVAVSTTSSTATTTTTIAATTATTVGSTTAATTEATTTTTSSTPTTTTTTHTTTTPTTTTSTPTSTTTITTPTTITTLPTVQLNFAQAANGRTYAFVDETTISWDDAEKKCTTSGAHLAIPSDSYEAKILMGLGCAASKCLLGVHDKTNEGAYEGVDGNVVPYYITSNITSGSGNSLSEDCTQMVPISPTIVFISCTTSTATKYICEKS